MPWPHWRRPLRLAKFSSCCRTSNSGSVVSAVNAGTRDRSTWMLSCMAIWSEARSSLIVPHPRYTARQFVLQPACDVAAHYRDPRFGWTLERLARHLREGASFAGPGWQRSRHSRTNCVDVSRANMGFKHSRLEPCPEPMQVVGNAPAARNRGAKQVEVIDDESSLIANHCGE